MGRPWSRGSSRRRRCRWVFVDWWGGGRSGDGRSGHPAQLLPVLLCNACRPLPAPQTTTHPPLRPANRPPSRRPRRRWGCSGWCSRWRSAARPQAAPPGRWRRSSRQPSSTSGRPRRPGCAAPPGHPRPWQPIWRACRGLGSGLGRRARGRAAAPRAACSQASGSSSCSRRWAAAAQQPVWEPGPGDRGRPSRRLRERIRRRQVRPQAAGRPQAPSAR
jgi:hypothetical protein